MKMNYLKKENEDKPKEKNNEDYWTQGEQDKFEELLIKYKGIKDLKKKLKTISEQFKTKTLKQITSRYKSIALKAKKKKDENDKDKKENKNLKEDKKDINKENKENRVEKNEKVDEVKKELKEEKKNKKEIEKEKKEKEEEEENEEEEEEDDEKIDNKEEEKDNDIVNFNLDDFLDEDEEEKEKEEKEIDRFKHQEEDKEAEQEEVSDISYEGYMQKKSHSTWQTRFFQIKNGYLYWFKDKTSSIVQNKISIKNTLRVDSHKDKKFMMIVANNGDNKDGEDGENKVELGGKVYKFACQSDEEKNGWVSAITNEMKRLKKGDEKGNNNNRLEILERKKIIIDYFNLPEINKDIFYMKKKVIEEMNNENYFKPSLRKIEALRRKQKREEKERKLKEKEEKERKKREEKEEKEKKKKEENEEKERRKKIEKEEKMRRKIEENKKIEEDLKSGKKVGVKDRLKFWFRNNVEGIKAENNEENINKAENKDKEIIVNEMNLEDFGLGDEDEDENKKDNNINDNNNIDNLDNNKNKKDNENKENNKEISNENKSEKNNNNKENDNEKDKEINNNKELYCAKDSHKENNTDNKENNKDNKTDNNKENNTDNKTDNNIGNNNDKDNKYEKDLNGKLGEIKKQEKETNEDKNFTVNNINEKNNIIKEEEIGFRESRSDKIKGWFKNKFNFRGSNIEEENNEKEEKERKEKEEKDKREKEEKEKKEKERREKEKKEKEEKERKEKEKKEKEEKERREKEKKEKEEKERKEKERKEKERKEKERKEKERQEKERKEKERQEEERQEKERQEKIKSDNRKLKQNIFDPKKFDEENQFVAGTFNPNPYTKIDNNEQPNSLLPEQWRTTCQIKIDEDSYPDKNAPRLDLKPYHIFGYREKDAHNNIKYIDNDSFLYPSGNIAIIQNISNKAQQYFIRHKREICSLCVNYDRTIIATGEENVDSLLSSYNNSVIRIWESKTLKELAEIEIPFNGVRALSFNLNGKYLVCCCLDENHKVVVINVKEKKIICEEYGNRKKIFSLSFKSNNEFATAGLNHFKFWIISESENNGQIEYKLISKEYLNTSEKEFDDKLGIISVMNDYFVTGSSLGYITLWKDQIIKNNKKCHDSQIDSLYSNNRIIISGGRDKVLKVLDKDLAILKTISLESDSILNFSPRSIDILPGQPEEKGINKILVGTSSGDILELIFKKSIFEDENPEIKIYNSSHYSKNTKDINEITSISFSKKLNFFVTTSEDKTIRFWNIFNKSQDNFIFINEEMKPTASNFSNKENIFVVGFDNGKMRFYSTEKNLTMIKEFQKEKRNNPITVIKYNDKDTLLACATKDEKGNNIIDIYFWDSLNLYATLTGAQNEINGLDWSEDGHFLVTYSHQKECRVFSILDKFMISEYDKVDYLLWCSWTLGYGWPLKGYYEAFDIPIYSCERFYIVYGNNIIALGDFNGAVKLYKYPIINKDQKYIKHDIQHGKKVTNVKYGKVGIKDIILTSSSDGSLIAWQIESI